MKDDEHIAQDRGLQRGMCMLEAMEGKMVHVGQEENMMDK